MDDRNTLRRLRIGRIERSPIQPQTLIQQRRRIQGISAVLLPFDSAGQVDWTALVGLIERTLAAGLTPAINMDTGYANLIDDNTRRKVLEITRTTVSGRKFVAGAFVADQQHSPFQREAYLVQLEQIQSLGGIPIIFQSYGLAHQEPEVILDCYVQLAGNCDQFFFFELAETFAPFGKIYSLDVYSRLMQIPNCLGAKHSSLRRLPEWQRLRLRNEQRPEFMVLTGNDLAIDMVMYGSDYLLGLSTFSPDLFAERDKYWETDDPRFYELNDQLQYLGWLAFRRPTPAYKHSAAMFLKMRGWIQSDRTHPDCPQRPAADRDLLQEIGERMGLTMKGGL